MCVFVCVCVCKFSLLARGGVVMVCVSVCVYVYVCLCVCKFCRPSRGGKFRKFSGVGQLFFSTQKSGDMRCFLELILSENKSIYIFQIRRFVSQTQSGQLSGAQHVSLVIIIRE